MELIRTFKEHQKLLKITDIFNNVGIYESLNLLAIKLSARFLYVILDESNGSQYQNKAHICVKQLIKSPTNNLH